MTPALALTYYKVNSGDSLYKIGQWYGGISFQQLQRVNGLNSFTIYPGQVLKIPTVYTVHKGDSWYLIARKFGVSVDQLKWVNNKWSDEIFIGDKLVIPITSVTVTASRGFSGYSREDVTLLARAISGEARGEPYIGQVAVGAVILNRVKNSKFPNSISGVIFQKGAFSSVTDGQIWLEPTPESLKASTDALNGWDPSEGALYFYNPAKPCAPWIFSRTVIKRIGNHVFAR